eukprot:62348-Lingulodinium_polyedra.AAC.1
MSVWTPSEQHAGSWLVSADGAWTQLQGPCLLGQGGVLPLQRDEGVFWLEVGVEQPTPPGEQLAGA